MKNFDYFKGDYPADEEVGAVEEKTNESGTIIGIPTEQIVKTSAPEYY